MLGAVLGAGYAGRSRGDEASSSWSAQANEGPDKSTGDSNSGQQVTFSLLWGPDLWVEAGPGRASGGSATWREQH